MDCCNDDLDYDGPYEPDDGPPLEINNEWDKEIYIGGPLEDEIYDREADYWTWSDRL